MAFVLIARCEGGARAAVVSLVQRQDEPARIPRLTFAKTEESGFRLFDNDDLRVLFVDAEFIEGGADRIRDGLPCPSLPIPLINDSVVVFCSSSDLVGCMAWAA